MTKTDPMFQLLKQCLSITSDFTELDIKDKEWNDIYVELCHHSIEALPYKYLNEYSIPDDYLYQKWMNRCVAIIGNWARVMHGQQELLELLENNGVECVIIKGAAAALSYPIPQLRTMGDVDFLVYRADYEKTAELLENSGYKLVGEKNPRTHHYEYTKNGIEYELHKRLEIVRDSNDILNMAFEEGIRNREIKQLGKYAFPVLPTRLNGLVLLLHIDQHLRSGLGMKQIIDWMMYVHCNGLEQILPLAQSLGMEKFALSVTAMCEKYLGLQSIVSNVDEYPCDELMHHLIESGNFGRKSGEKGKVSSVFRDTNSPAELFGRLQQGGILKLNTLSKHRLIKLFAWIYQVFFIINELKRNKINWKDMLIQRNEAIKQRELINQLGLKPSKMEDLEEV